MLAGEIVTGPQRLLQWKEIFLFPTNSFVKLTPFLVCSAKRTNECEAGKNK